MALDWGMQASARDSHSRKRTEGGWDSYLDAGAAAVAVVRSAAVKCFAAEQRHTAECADVEVGGVDSAPVVVAAERCVVDWELPGRAAQERWFDLRAEAQWAWLVFVKWQRNTVTRCRASSANKGCECGGATAQEWFVYRRQYRKA